MLEIKLYCIHKISSIYSMEKDSKLYQDALAWQRKRPLGAVKMEATKKVNGTADLALAYSPGIAAPCLEIKADPDAAYLYTGKGNSVAMISNGTAVLGLGNIGSLASKPVMEGKSLLMREFGYVNTVDVEIDSVDVARIIDVIKAIGNTWGGINLEDIKAPDCFLIENAAKEHLSIPVFHDDQHGTAIAVLAALDNALLLQKKDLSSVKIVINGAGAAAIACANLLVQMGARKENVILCDSRGVIHTERNEGMNQWKREYMVQYDANMTTLQDAMSDADVFLGLSVKNAVTKDMVRSMAAKPIIFAMANPEPEILPEHVNEVRDDVVMATGRSDYPNQVNNLVAFPYIFRGALDVRASEINDAMKIAAAKAIAQLVREDHDAEVPFGKDYILPKAFDARLYEAVSSAVAMAAIESGVAKEKFDKASYAKHLKEFKEMMSS